MRKKVERTLVTTVFEPAINVWFKPKNELIPLFLVLILEYIKPSFSWDYIVNFESILLQWWQIYAMVVLLFICTIVRVLLFEKRENKEEKANKKVPYVGSKIFLPERTILEKMGYYARQITLILSPIWIILSLFYWIVLIIKILQFL